MPRIHVWNPSAGQNAAVSAPSIFGPSSYLDGTTFSPGDLLLVTGGAPGVMPSYPNPSYTLVPGTFLFSDATGANENFVTDNIILGSTSSIEVTGPQQLTWGAFDQFTNNGLIRVGSSAASGSVHYLETVSGIAQGVQLTNSGTIEVQNGSTFQADGAVYGNTLTNNAGGLIQVSTARS